MLVLCVADAEGLPIARRDGGDCRAWHVNDLDDVIHVDQMNGVITLFDELDELGHGSSSFRITDCGSRAGILAGLFSGCQPRQLAWLGSTGGHFAADLQFEAD